MLPRLQQLVNCGQRTVNRFRVNGNVTESLSRCRANVAARIKEQTHPISAQPNLQGIPLGNSSRDRSLEDHDRASRNRERSEREGDEFAPGERDQPVKRPREHHIPIKAGSRYGTVAQSGIYPWRD